MRKLRKLKKIRKEKFTDREVYKIRGRKIDIVIFDELTQKKTREEIDSMSDMKNTERTSINAATPEEWDEAIKEEMSNRIEKTISKERKRKYNNSPHSTYATSDGSTAAYYQLPMGSTELQHLISHKDMNSQIGEIFRSCYRYGEVSHSDKLRDAKKIKFYIEAELERLERL